MESKTVKTFKGCCAVCGYETKGREPLDEEAERLLGVLGNLQVCRYCGYVNIRIGKRPPLGVNREWLSSDAYVTCEGMSFKTEDLKQKYRYYMIRRMSEDLLEQANALLDLREGLKIPGMSENKKQTEIITEKLIETYKRILASNPDDCKALFNCCEEMMGLKRYKEVIELTEQMKFPDTKKGRNARELALKEHSVATKYYEITTDFSSAFKFLNDHPVFGNNFQDCLDIDVDPKKGQDPEAISKEYEIWLECGPYDEDCATHDYDLDCEGDTFEEAIIRLAENVLRVYGMNGAAFSSFDGHTPVDRRSDDDHIITLWGDEVLEPDKE